MSNKRKYVGAPLRPGLDDDIDQALAGHTGESKADLIRTGLRIVLGIAIHKQKVIQTAPVPRPSVFLSKSLRTQRD